MRLLLLQLGTPVVHGVSVRDNRAAGTLRVPAAADQKAVCACHGNGHSDPNIIHHLGELFVPLLQKMVCEMLLRILSLSPCNAIDRVDCMDEDIGSSSPSPAVQVLSGSLCSGRNKTGCP